MRTTHCSRHAFIPCSNLSTSRKSLSTLFGVAAAIVLTGASILSAQTAHFGGAQSTVGSGFSNPAATAIDANGNVYVADLGHGAVKEILAVNGVIPPSPTMRALGGSFNAPSAIAVDGAGDVIVASSGDGTIKEMVAVNGSIPASPNVIVLAQIANPAGVAADSAGDVFISGGCQGEGSVPPGTLCGFVEEFIAVNGVLSSRSSVTTLPVNPSGPSGVAVDRNGNVYVADNGNSQLVEVLATNGSVTQSSATRVVTHLAGVGAVAVDNSGDLFVSTPATSTVYEIQAINGSVPTTIPSGYITTVGAGLSFAGGVAVDGNENVYIADFENNRVVAVALPGGNFGSVNVQATATPISLNFTFDTSGTLGSIAALTNGVSGLDFLNAGSGTCAANTAYTAGQSCTVNASFKPGFPGIRNGAIVLSASNGNAIATGYVQGTGVGPQVNFLPATQSVVSTGTSSTAPQGVAVDGAGNVFVSAGTAGVIFKESPFSGGYAFEGTIGENFRSAYGIAFDGRGNIYIADPVGGGVYQELPTSGVSVPNIIGSGFSHPSSVAVDGSGNLYITDTGLGQVIKESLTKSGYMQSQIPTTGLSTPGGVGVDASGNVYIADAYNGRVLKESPVAGSYSQSNVVTGLGQPGAIALDGMGNVYVADLQNNQILEETWTGSSYAQTMVASLANGVLQPTGIAVDSTGNIYIAQAQNFQVLKQNVSTPPRLTFASTAPGTTSPDSPKTVTVENTGNAALTFPVPTSGNNPAIATSFSVSSGQSWECPSLSASSSTPGTLAAGTFCQLFVSFTPAASGNFSGSLTLTDNNLNATAPAYATQSIALSGAGVLPAPPLTWATPSPIAYGTPLSAVQLNATSSLPGTFYYSSPAGTVLSAGTHTLTVTFEPTDSTDYSYANQTVSLVVTQANPQVNWANPAAIAYGTALSATQLNATSSVSGSFVYTPSAGVSLGAGTQTLSVIFTPTDTTDYTTATQTVSLTVNQATPSIVWANPAAITYGTALSAIQLNATASVAGSFVYTPGAGAALGAGTQTLSVTFTPTDTTDYTTATQTASLVVNRATPAITWANPAAITYGTTLSASQLNATSSVAGSFVYTPSVGAALGAGTQTLSVTFTPTDTTDYTTATQTASLVVSQAVPSISWASPAAITYGTALSASQLSATSPVAGAFSYTPASGTVLGAGTQVLSATFTPTDAVDYTTASSTVSLTVTKGVPPITWATPAAISYDTPLSTTQLNASSTVAGTFSYSPAAGAVLTTGPQTLTVTFTPTDTADYTSTAASVTLTVNKAAPPITWSAPAPITYGAALTSTQLNASSSIAGTFAYSPAAGTVLTGGSQPLAVTFTPSDTADYSTATGGVSLTVNAAPTSISWIIPGAITYGTPLSATQLDATASVPGTFVYSPAAGTVLNAGTQSLSVIFTPSNTANYLTSSASAALTVNKATPVISWPTPAAIAQGTALSSTQLDATSSVAGGFTYSPAAGSVLSAGSQTLTTTFTPTNTSNYTNATGSVILTVNSAPSFTLAASPASLSIAQGASGTSTITLTGKNGFSSSATLTASGLPSGVTASFSTNPITGSSVVTLTASSTATVGAATVVITGTSGSLTATTSVALTVTAKAGFACHVIYSVSSQWQSGFGTAITIENTGTTAITNWTLTFAFANGQKVTQIWNGNETQSGANVTVTNMSYNGSIPAGGSYNGMGFNGSWNNVTNAVPTSFSVNGTVCK